MCAKAPRRESVLAETPYGLRPWGSDLTFARSENGAVQGGVVGIGQAYAHEGYRTSVSLPGRAPGVYEAVCLAVVDKAAIQGQPELRDAAVDAFERVGRKAVWVYADSRDLAHLPDDKFGAKHAMTPFDRKGDYIDQGQGGASSHLGEDEALSILEDVERVKSRVVV